MKKIIFTLASVAALSLIATSCNKEGTSEESAVEGGETFVASICNEETTRTAIDGTIVKWSEGDQVYVNGLEYTAYPKAKNPTTADLWQNNPAEAAPKAPYKAFYPASMMDDSGVMTLPATQKYGSLDISPMYAVSYDGYLKFKNLCSLLAIKIGLPSDGRACKVNSIVVSADKDLYGEFNIEKTNGGYKAVINSTRASATVNLPVTLKCDPSVTPAADSTIFYVAIPAQSYEFIKIEVFRDGAVFTESMQTTKPCTTKESVIYYVSFNDGAILYTGEKCALPGYNTQSW